MGKEIKTGTVFHPKDFCENDDLRLKAVGTELEATVRLTAGGSGCHFQWDMTAEGARVMAAMLLASATEAEALTQAVTA